MGDPFEDGVHAVRELDTELRDSARPLRWRARQIRDMARLLLLLRSERTEGQTRVLTQAAERAEALLLAVE